MKKMTKILTVGIAFLTLVSCSFTLAQDSEIRNPGPFAQVHSGGSWDVVLVEGNKEEVRIEARGIALSKVKTVVEGDVLKLGLERGNYNNVDLKFYVTYRQLEGLKCSGSGEMEVKSPLTAKKFFLGVSGSGDVELKSLQADELNATISGSADISIEAGSIGVAQINQSGSGDFEAAKVSIDKLNVSKSGSGDTLVGELGELSLKSSGSGNLVYSGSPRMGDVKVSGSSNIRKR
jgi:hypothetical protein